MQLARFIEICACCLVVLACFGCGDKRGDAIDQRREVFEDTLAKHPNYPILKRADFAADNGPFPMIVYGNYGYVRVVANEKSDPFDAKGASAKIAKAITLAIGEVQKTEKESPPPSKIPTRKEWKEIPHPPLGAYIINVSAGVDLPQFSIAGTAGSSVEQDSAKIQAVADSIVAVLLKSQNAGLASTTSNLPPSGFSVDTTEAMARFAASRGNGPNPVLRSGNLCILPLDAAKATAALKRAATQVVSELHNSQPDAKQASVVVHGPSGETAFSVPFGPTASKTIDAGLSPVTAWIESADKKISPN